MGARPRPAPAGERGRAHPARAAGAAEPRLRALARCWRSACSASGLRSGRVLIGHSAVFAPLMYPHRARPRPADEPGPRGGLGDLGASRARTFLRVSLPGIAPGIIAGAFLVFMQSARQRLGDAVPRRAGHDDAAAAPLPDARGKPRRPRGGGLRPADRRCPPVPSGFLARTATLSARPDVALTPPKQKG